MANSFIAVKNIARLTLPRLIENLVMPELCFRDYSEAFSDLGDTIQVKKPVVYTASEFNPASGTVVEQDITEGSVDVVLNHLATVDVSINALEAAVSWSEEKLIRDFLEPAAAALAAKINADGVGEYVNIPNLIGTFGTTPSTMGAFAAARKFLNTNKAPNADRYAVWDVEADAKFTELTNLIHANEAASTETLREGSIGRIYGIDNYMTQAIKAHTTSATGTILVDGDAARGSSLLHVDGVTAALTVGDVITIAGDTTKYTVNKAGALDTNDQDVWLTPALQANAGDNTAVTVQSGAKTNNLIFHRNAIAFVTRPLHTPEGGVEAYTTTDRGYSLRVVKGYDMSTKKEKLSMDVLYGYKVVYPEIAARYVG